MAQKKVWTTEEINEIVDLYVNKKISALKLSFTYECDQQTIRNLLVEQGVEIRGRYSKKFDPELIANLAEDFKNKNYTNLKELAKKYGVSTSYIGELRRDWMKQNGIEWHTYEKKHYGGIPIEDLYKLRDKMKIGEVIYMTEPSESCVDAYFYGLAVGKSYFAKVLAKYPNHAITDYGCKPWQDIRDAIKRFKQNEHLRERYGI